MEPKNKGSENPLHSIFIRIKVSIPKNDDLAIHSLISTCGSDVWEYGALAKSLVDIPSHHIRPEKHGKTAKIFSCQSSNPSNPSNSNINSNSNSNSDSNSNSNSDLNLV